MPQEPSLQAAATRALLRSVLKPEELVDTFPDPIDRAQVAGQMLDELAFLVRTYAAVREAAVLELVDGAGLSLGDVADELGVSKSMAQKIAERGRERAVVVEPRPGGKWAVQRDESKRASSVQSTQAAAERLGRRIARNQGAELVVKDKDGRVRRKDSHGSDPRSSKG